jgi:hypothetical protein
MKKKQNHTTPLEEFKALLARKTFRPFRVTLRSSESFDFRDEKDGMYREDKGWIYWFGGTGPMAFWKPEEITSVEVL